MFVDHHRLGSWVTCSPMCLMSLVHWVFARTLCVVVIPTRSSASTPCRQVAHGQRPQHFFQHTKKREQGRVRPCRFVRRHDHFTAGVRRFYCAEVFSSPSAHVLRDGDNIAVGVERSCHAEVLFQQFSACEIPRGPVPEQHGVRRLHPQKAVRHNRAVKWPDHVPMVWNSCAEVLPQPGSVAAESTTLLSR